MSGSVTRACHLTFICHLITCYPVPRPLRLVGWGVTGNARSQVPLCLLSFTPVTGSQMKRWPMLLAPPLSASPPPPSRAWVPILGGAFRARGWNLRAFTLWQARSCWLSHPIRLRPRPRPRPRPRGNPTVPASGLFAGECGLESIRISKQAYNISVAFSPQEGVLG